MTLARSFPDDATEWWIFLGSFALYVLGRWFFAWRQARREGDDHPVRAAFAEEDDSDAMTAATGGFRSYRQFSGFVVGAVTVVLVVALTDGRLRVSLLWVVVPLLVVALSYLDFREARKARSRV
ncbi:hypothetical protein [Streptomyces sp. Tu 3180]|uniref:hypothetical protein n=1 Tax=Streptomyces sp. Tu 3180 TaxID=2682611 RepID=UPI00135B52CA|nr:hypothetical protein [Streptomyces sp. Tu 3180]KAF3467482.1 hypothetical protein GL259_26355 [Streptomyces sp. Tu 3180]